MFKLMLVDDEPDIREGLREIIRFEELGFTVVGEAENGVEALQACEALSPDVIITDIRMPLMDGLTMCREIKKILPTAHFIILSGYDDFEYAQRAIEMGSMRYLLKPISSVEFTQMLISVRETLEQEFAQRRDLSTLRQHFQSSLPLLREALLSSLLSGGMSAENALKAAGRYSMQLDAPRYVLALMRLDRANGGAIEDPELMSVAVANIAHDVLSRKRTSHLFHYNNEIAILILLPDRSDEAFAGALSALEDAQKNIEHYLSAKALIGVSAPCENLTQLGVSANQALLALDQSSILSINQVLCTTEVECDTASAFAADQQTLRALGNAISACDRAQCRELVDQLISACTDARPTPRMYRIYMMDICMAILHRARDMAIECAREPDDFEKALNALMHCPPPDQARKLLLAYCDSLIREIGDRRVSGGRQLVNQAIEILTDQYVQEDMGIERVCQQLHISTSYFGVLFKRETRKTLHQYLTDLRMDKAMALLAGGAARTAEVALAVGIPDPSYFSYAFKKHFGMSPSQARKTKEET